MRKIIKLEPAIPALPKRKKVAAYARVSMESEKLMHSLSAQISYFSELIQKNPEWEYAGVYADRFISGTSIEKRAEFQRLITDCEAGKINIVLCKSISRFARNTVDLLKTVRHLKELGVEVRFEKENISSMSSDGEMMLTLLASCAEQESITQSENLKWAVSRKFERGEPWGNPVFGYIRIKNDYIINEEEAEIVQKIYADFLADVPMGSIAKWLKSINCRCVTPQFVKNVLTNITYTGDLILQQHFSPSVNHMQKNNGEMPKYYASAHHPAIISRELFEQVQQKMQTMLAFNPEAHRVARVSCFSSKITCAVCGNHYVRYDLHDRKSWACFGKITSRKKNCQNGNLSIDKLEKLCCSVLNWDIFDESQFTKTVHNLLVRPDGKVVFTFYDGTIAEGYVRFFNSEDRKYLDPHTKFYGYTWTGTEYVINEEEAEAVRMVYEDYLNEMTISDISRKMENLGYHSKRGRFSRKLVLYLLSNPFYTGTRIYPAAYSGTGKEETVRNDHDAIITEEQFEKARERREYYAKRHEDSRNPRKIHSTAD
ncbi:MAG TPA: recombinase [Ruminococcus sp.]|nr:recombinase [Ruminococcus sp.]